MNPPTSGFSVRPRFEQVVEPSPDELRDLLVSGAVGSAECEVRSTTGMVVIHVASAKRDRWSPRLQLSLEPDEGGGTHVVGVYGPEHEVWAFFIYGYIVTGLLGTFSGIYGFAQMFIGEMPWALWICGSMLVVAGGLYLAAQLGQKFGAWQTFELHQLYETAVKPS